MTGYSTQFGTGNVNKTGAINGGDRNPSDKNPGGSGAIPAVVGKDTPIIVKTGATNGGRTGS